MSIEQWVQNSMQKFENISILNNTAGMFDQYSPLLDISFEQWAKLMAINLDGIFR